MISREGILRMLPPMLPVLRSRRFDELELGPRKDEEGEGIIPDSPRLFPALLLLLLVALVGVVGVIGTVGVVGVVGVVEGMGVGGGVVGTVEGGLRLWVWVPGWVVSSSASSGIACNDARLLTPTLRVAPLVPKAAVMGAACPR